MLDGHGMHGLKILGELAHLGQSSVEAKFEDQVRAAKSRATLEVDLAPAGSRRGWHSCLRNRAHAVLDGHKMHRLRILGELAHLGQSAEEAKFKDRVRVAKSRANLDVDLALAGSRRGWHSCSRNRAHAVLNGHGMHGLRILGELAHLGQSAEEAKFEDRVRAAKSRANLDVDLAPAGSRQSVPADGGAAGEDATNSRADGWQ